MNKIWIELLTKKSHFHFVKLVSVLPGICWCGHYYMNQYLIYNNFTVFCQDFNHEIKNILKINPSYHGILRDKENIQLIFGEWMKIEFGYKKCTK